MSSTTDSMPRGSTSRLLRSSVSPLDSDSGSKSASTRSAPRAWTQSAAATLESMPPDTATIAPRLRSRRKTSSGSVAPTSSSAARPSSRSASTVSGPSAAGIRAGVEPASDVAGDRVDGVEVLGEHVGVGNLELVRRFQVLDELEHADGVDHADLEQRVAAGEIRAASAEREVVGDEPADFGLDRCLLCHLSLAFVGPWTGLEGIGTAGRALSRTVAYVSFGGATVCGIAGIYARSGRHASPELLLAMAGELRHRGPDGVGLYLDGRYGMSNTRLAIVDLEGGDQPLSSESGRYWVMQNGEVYNYVELQDELRTLGHRFETSSDTEVLAHAYEEWGPDCLHRLNGDFAFAVWDRQTQEVFVARDRFGVRPLFVAELDGDLVFGSEAKALLRHPSARRELDPLGLVEAFTIWSILPDRSAFAGIRELAPAHFLRFGPDGVIEERRWWDHAFPRVGEKRAETEAEPQEELDRKSVAQGRARG